jgi:hypothetical protein
MENNMTATITNINLTSGLAKLTAEGGPERLTQIKMMHKLLPMPFTGFQMFAASAADLSKDEADAVYFQYILGDTGEMASLEDAQAWFKATIDSTWEDLLSNGERLQARRPLNTLEFIDMLHETTGATPQIARRLAQVLNIPDELSPEQVEVNANCENARKTQENNFGTAGASKRVHNN